MDIPAPSKPATDPDYFIACQEAMAVWFNSLADISEMAGWDGDIVAAALLKLADANLKSRQANRETDAAISDAKQALSGRGQLH